MCGFGDKTLPPHTRSECESVKRAPLVACAINLPQKLLARAKKFGTKKSL